MKPPAKYTVTRTKRRAVSLRQHEESDLLLRVDFHLSLVLLEFGSHECQLALETRHVLGQLERLVFLLCQAASQISHFVASSLALFLLVVQPAPQRHSIVTTDSTITSSRVKSATSEQLEQRQHDPSP